MPPIGVMDRINHIDQWTVQVQQHLDLLHQAHKKERVAQQSQSRQTEIHTKDNVRRVRIEEAGTANLQKDLEGRCQEAIELVQEQRAAAINLPSGRGQNQHVINLCQVTYGFLDDTEIHSTNEERLARIPGSEAPSSGLLRLPGPDRPDDREEMLNVLADLDEDTTDAQKEDNWRPWKTSIVTTNGRFFSAMNPASRRSLCKLRMPRQN